MVVIENHFKGDGLPTEKVEIHFCDVCGKRIEPHEPLNRVGKKELCLFCYENTEGVDKE